MAERHRAAELGKDCAEMEEVRMRGRESSGCGGCEAGATASPTIARDSAATSAFFFALTPLSPHYHPTVPVHGL